jgi:N-acetylneuraminic acid mutarotase
MRRIWFACVTLLLLSGCTSHPSAAQDAAYKQAFVRQLVGYCADVDRNLPADPNAQPGQVADQLNRFASQARSHTPPSSQREQLDSLLAAFDDAVRQFRAAQAALSSGNGDAYRTAINQADQTMQKANTAAVRYGMPPLNDCPKVQGGPQPTTVAQPVPVWHVGSDSPYATQQVGAAELAGRIWVAGGLTGLTSATASTETYDSTHGTWVQGPPLPVPLHHAMMVRYHRRVWVIGGFEPQGSEVSGTVSARVLYLNNSQTAWVEGPPLHHARAAGAAVVVGNEIVVVGGRTAGASAADVAPTEVFNGTSWHDAAGIPVTGDHVAAASDGRYVYVVGGRKLEVSANTAAVQRFDPQTDTWTQLPPVPSPVSDCGVAIVGGKLIVVGGESVGTVFNTVRAFDLATSTWSTLPPLPAARHGEGVAVIGNTLYAIDGAAKPGHNASTPTLQILTIHS